MQRNSATMMAMMIAIIVFLDRGCFLRTALVPASPIASPAPSPAPSATPVEIIPQMTREERFVAVGAMTQTVAAQVLHRYRNVFGDELGTRV